MRGRPRKVTRWPSCLVFQSTPPCGGDGGFASCISAAVVFQSTPPCGGDRSPGSSTAPSADFNPRPHAGATVDKSVDNFPKGISIHAPMRGRPEQPVPSCSWVLISIHAPMRGRRIIDGSVHNARKFQSTPPCGGDYWLLFKIYSILNFNPRPHAGATVLSRKIFTVTSFQSTPPCGGDILGLPETAGEDISIHAPMRGRHPLFMATLILL